MSHKKIRTLLLGGALFAAAVIPYLPSLNGEFVWDDRNGIEENPMLRDWSGLAKIWTTLFVKDAWEANYWPVVHSSFWLDYQLWGLFTLPYHVNNLVLHAINTLLIWLILRKMIDCGAWLAALIFAVHPVHVESVAWIIERKDLLSTFFTLAAFMAYLRFDEKPSRVFYVASLFAFLLGLLSKSVAVSLPLILLLWILWERLEIARKDLCRLSPFFALSIASSVLGIITERTRNMYDYGIDLPERFILVGRTFWFYLIKVFWPGESVAIYPLWDLDSSSLALYAFPFLCLCLFATLWFARRHIGLVPLFVLSAFVVILAPTLGFFNFAFFSYAFVADRFLYLALVCPTAFFAFYLSRFSQKNVFVRAIIFFAILVMSVQTWRESRVYTSEENLFRHCLSINPKAFHANINLTDVLIRKRSFDEAEGYALKALELDRRSPLALNNMGRIAALKGRSEESILFFEKVLEIEPNHPEANGYLGKTLADRGDFEEAMLHYRRALEVSPALTPVRIDLGAILASLGRTDEAVAQYKEAIRFSPNNPEAHFKLANAYSTQKRWSQAIEEYSITLALAPNSDRALLGIGLAFLEQNQPKSAIPALEKAQRINPKSEEISDALKSAHSYR